VYLNSVAFIENKNTVTNKRVFTSIASFMHNKEELRRRISTKLFTRNRTTPMAGLEICITKTMSRLNRFFVSTKPRYHAIHAQLNSRMPLPSDPAPQDRGTKSLNSRTPFSSTFTFAAMECRGAAPLRSSGKTHSDVSQDVRVKGIKFEFS